MPDNTIHSRPSQGQPLSRRLSDGAAPRCDIGERAVLACMMLSPEAALDASKALSRHDFLRQSHRDIFAAMCESVETGDSTELPAISAKLELANRLELVGGAHYLASLLDEVPTPGLVEHYASLVAEAAHMRRVALAAAELAEAARQNEVDRVPELYGLLAAKVRHE